VKVSISVRRSLAHVVALGFLPVLKGLLDLVLQVAKVHHVVLDLVDGELDEHTGDLGCLFISDESLDVLVDAATDLLLHVRVVGVQGWDILGSLSQVLLADGHHLVLLWHHAAHVLVGLWWHLLLLLLGHWLLTHHSWVLWHLAHLVHALHVLLLASHTALVLHVLLVMHVLTHASLVVVASVLSWSLVVLTSVSELLVTHVHLLVGLLVILNDTEKLLKHLSKMRLRGQVIPLKSSGLLGLVLLPVSLVTSLFHLKLSDLLDLVVVDQEHLALAVVVLQVLFGLSGISWLLVANKSKGIASVLALVQSDVLDVTVSIEQLHQLVLGPVIWEVLHIQVASLL